VSQEINIYSGDSQISVRHAYIAMFEFVRHYKSFFNDDGNVTLLLSDLAPEPDPSDDSALWTSDPGFWSEWLDAVKSAEAGPPADWFVRPPK
jgi:hypothetical protein